MRALLILFVLLLGHAAHAGCPVGSHPSPTTGKCRPERRVVLPPAPSPSPGVVPRSTPAPDPGNPQPQGFEFKPTTVQWARYVETSATVIVHPEGLSVDGDPVANLQWMFMTQGNRATKNIELFPGYSTNGAPFFNVFDWSCSVADPCIDQDEDVLTTPSYVIARPIDPGMTQYYFDFVDGVGHPHTGLRYRNRTERLPGDAALPHYRNRGLLWNPGDQTWDIIYEHTYSVHQWCYACAGWALFVEAYKVVGGDPWPPVQETGFHHATFEWDNRIIDIRDGGPYTEATDDTAPWPLLHQGPGQLSIGNAAPEPVATPTVGP
jgi:hypothetical protein